jgi:two-component system response regulator DctR
MTSTQDTLADGIVLIVEDDTSLREALSAALEIRGIDYLEFETYDEVDAHLTLEPINRPTCMLLDIRLGHGPTGLNVFQTITGLGLETRVPVIFMTGHGELDTAVQVMRDGAFDFVSKPFSTPDLMSKVESALSASLVTNQAEDTKLEILELLGQLTDKESEVMRLMVEGKTNREIAEICGNSTRTVELHRARIFDKLKVSNAVELVGVLGLLTK